LLFLYTQNARELEKRKDYFSTFPAHFLCHAQNAPDPLKFWQKNVGRPNQSHDICIFHHQSATEYVDHTQNVNARLREENQAVREELAAVKAYATCVCLSVLR
jgi:hypothetical protein